MLLFLSAPRGSIINVPAGSSTWTSILTISKGLFIKGAGIGNTIITSNQNSIIFYLPDSTAINNNERLEVSGFTFNGFHSYGSIYIDQRTTGAISNILIHENKFLGCSKGIGLKGNIYGVAYNNQFEKTGSQCTFLDALGNDRDSWDNHPASFGSANNFYMEDNNFEGNFWMEGGHGGRYVLRYNTWNNQNGFDMLDAHGNQPGLLYSTMLIEVYGNLWTNLIYSGGPRWIDLRGGQAMFFNNLSSGTSTEFWLDVDEETCDSVSPCNSCTQHVNNAFFWNNTYNGTRSNVNPAYTTNACPGEYSISLNVDFFNYNPSCTSSSCTAGIGCGATPPTGNCTTGVGYWVTSYSPCSTPPSTLENMKTYTQAGTFYKCTSTDTWTLYYRPYTYPHPLRSGETGAVSTPTGFRIVTP